MAKDRLDRKRALLFRLGTFSDAETRSQAQKPARKDPEPKWPKTGHLGSGPLTLRFLSGPVHALCICNSSPI